METTESEKEHETTYKLHEVVIVITFNRGVADTTKVGGQTPG